MNTDVLHRLVFRGRVVDQFCTQQARHNAAKLFGKDVAAIEPYFSGREVVLKTQVPLLQAQQYRDKLASYGLQVDIEPLLVASEIERAPEVQKPVELTAEQTAALKVEPQLPQPAHVEVKPAAQAETKPVSRQQRWRYRFDTFMARGGTSTFKALTLVFLVFFLLLASARGLLFSFSPDLAQQYGELDFFGNVYVTFLQLTDPGNMAQDILSSPWYKVFSVLAGLVGVILLSALIAFITTALDQKISELKRGRSKVVESNHTLILGWNEQRIIEIVRELVLANESEDDGCVVILADMDKEEMDDILRLRLPNTQNTRLVTRSGQISTLANLDMVSIEQARSVVVLASCADTASVEDKVLSDARVIQTILACEGRTQTGDDFCMVAEIYNQAYRQIVDNTFADHVVTVDTSEILAKLLVQTSRSVGLSVVYNEVLSFDGCELYFYRDDWGAIRFEDLLYRFPDGVALGVRHASGEILLRPEPDYRLRDDDDILIVADDDSTIEFKSEPVAQAQVLSLPDRRLQQKVERELVIGWNHKAPIILAEFAEYVCEGSQIDILLKSPSNQQREEISALNSSFEQVEIRLHEGDCLNRDHLLNLNPFEYDNIIILADGNAEVSQVDSANIVCLLLLRSIFDEHLEESANTKLITEVLDSQNYALVSKAGVKDVIISNRLVSMIIAQISESKDIKRVYDDLFSEDGSEIYLKPIELYTDQFPLEVSFADLMGLALKREEVCIGVKFSALETSAEDNYGVQLIPEKNTRFTFKRGDALVVLAEDEL